MSVVLCSRASFSFRLCNFSVNVAINFTCSFCSYDSEYNLGLLSGMLTVLASSHWWRMFRWYSLSFFTSFESLNLTLIFCSSFKILSSFFSVLRIYSSSVIFSSFGSLYDSKSATFSVISDTTKLSVSSSSSDKNYSSFILVFASNKEWIPILNFFLILSTESSWIVISGCSTDFSFKNGYENSFCKIPA